MRRKKEFFVPDLTPLIDVVFLLLIFFLVTSVFKKDELALKLQLPVSNYSTAKITSKDVDILISQTKFAYEDKELTLEELDKELSKIVDSKKLINVRIDADVKYQKIVKILDLLKKYSLSNIALVNKQTK